ncbi:hypothetical protein DFH07DRAFT_843543 [Mycena maculata]|uniref:Uncharacterized protein n=1 Tax=Mycena maculata TaxID=230809 RepID=A0AAD7I7D0_9AGAR|nr:hypothetical protein DFH07DRAFT_843543 [Mycena maculata]
MTLRAAEKLVATLFVIYSRVQSVRALHVWLLALHTSQTNAAAAHTVKNWGEWRTLAVRKTGLSVWRAWLFRVKN